jgi:hypothetical protein
MMKTVKLSITIPKPQYEFLVRKAADRAKVCGERPNVSREIKEIVQEKRSLQTQKQAERTP